MGLQIKPNGPAWSYSGFMEFRQKIVSTIAGKEIDLRLLYETDGQNEYKDDPIFVLINHSDCDGILTVKEMITIVPRLTEIVLKWDRSSTDNKFDFDQGMRLIRTMLDCIESDHIIEFM